MGQEIVRQPRKTYTLKAEEIFYYLFFAILLFACPKKRGGAPKKNAYGVAAPP